ncbi:hypothetical protein N1496_06645 [Streptococcus didelphis]|uniref:Uncharacterized protein n=2 Tax=Streptococcus didelphis TaxID=102886 RepID=A0ABY9LFT3_9STRE|nr:hypothetical protein [Streptococcus didelphis]WMB27757.1 hypothetical protein N1496_06645 [Streptococcus didelphis]
MYAVIKEVLRINEKLDIGSVRSPLSVLIESDKSICQEAASMIENVKGQFIAKR